MTNRSTKMTVFGCADAHGVVTYNGVGLDDDGLTPRDWIMELATGRNLFNFTFPEILAEVRIDMQKRLMKIRSKYGAQKARHTFVWTVWHHGVSVIYMTSNYESVDGPDEAREANETVSQSVLWPQTGKDIRIISTGVHPPMADIRKIGQAIKTNSINRAKALTIQAIKNVAYGRGRAGRGSVGASCQWAYVGPKRDDIWCGLEVVGGSVAQETPNLINIGANLYLGGTQSVRLGSPGVFIQDAYAGDERASRVGKYNVASKEFEFSELQCGICGSPWPASQKQCEVCLHDATK
jgi:hypothetical protein